MDSPLTDVKPTSLVNLHVLVKFKVIIHPHFAVFPSQRLDRILSPSPFSSDSCSPYANHQVVLGPEIILSLNGFTWQPASCFLECWSFPPPQASNRMNIWKQKSPLWGFCLCFVLLSVLLGLYTDLEWGQCCHSGLASSSARTSTPLPGSHFSGSIQ